MLNVIVDDTRDPTRNLALDEALGRVADRRPTASPVLRVWQNAPSVLVGRFQNVAAAVDLAACARDDVRIVRRATGGEAVHTDHGTLCFTLVHRQDPCQARGHSARAGGRPVPRPRAGYARAPYPRPGARPDLDVLVATAVEEFGLPAAALRDGSVVQAARLRTRGASLTHVAVHVAPRSPDGPGYITPAGASTARRTLADLGVDVTLDAVRAAVLSVIVDEYGIACTRCPDADERALRDDLHARRYGDAGWHLNGTRAARGERREFTGR